MKAFIVVYDDVITENISFIEDCMYKIELKRQYCRQRETVPAKFEIRYTNELLQELIDSNVIEKLISAYRSACFVIRNKNKSLRHLTYFHELNKR